MNLSNSLHQMLLNALFCGFMADCMAVDKILYQSPINDLLYAKPFYKC